MQNPLKEYRCKYCKKLFFKADLVDCKTQVKCKNCKKFNEIEGLNCPLLLSYGRFSLKTSDKKDNRSIKELIITECGKCKKIDDCGYYKLMKEFGICPFCKRP